MAGNNAGASTCFDHQILTQKERERRSGSGCGHERVVRETAVPPFGGGQAPALKRLKHLIMCKSCLTMGNVTTMDATAARPFLGRLDNDSTER